MFIAWRGWGPVALLAIIPSFTSCLGLIDRHELLAFTCAGWFMIFGGLPCLFLGYRWNRGTAGYHTLYWIRLEYWGWLYTIGGGLLFSFSVATMLKNYFLGVPR